MNHIFVLSDGTGRTAMQALSAALTQFSEDIAKIKITAGIRSVAEIEPVIKRARKYNGFVVHTIVSNDLRSKILELGKIHDVKTIDLMGPLLAQLSEQFSDKPLEIPGLFQKLNKAYFQRIESR